LPGLIPILCVGEQLADREAGRTGEVVAPARCSARAVRAAALEQAVVAYEPVWAIGTGRTATADQAQEVPASSAPGSEPAMLNCGRHAFFMAAA
jgi:triosephosphate isomerase